MKYSPLLQPQSKDVTRYVLGGELYAFAYACDYAYTIQHDLEKLWESIFH